MLPTKRKKPLQHQRSFEKLATCYISIYQSIYHHAREKMIDCLIYFIYIGFMEKKMFSTRINPDILKQAKKLAIDLDRPLNDLLEEALLDALKKYEKKSAKK
jgi:hypothetical protein